MAIEQKKPSAKPAPTLENKLVSRAQKEAEDVMVQQFRQRVAQGEDPVMLAKIIEQKFGGMGQGQPQMAMPDPNNQIMGMLTQLIQQKTQPATTGDKLQAGLTVLTGGLIPTPGYARIANQRKNPLNVNDLVSIIGLQNNLAAEQRRVAKDERQAPIDQANLMSKLLDIVAKTHDPQLASQIGVAPDFAIQRQQQEIQAKTEAEAISKQNTARRQLKRDLDDYFELDKAFQRGDGALSNLSSGIKSQIKMFGGSSEGAMMNTREAIVSRVKPRLAREASEVGNLNVFEQVAQGMIFPNKFDSKKTAQLKNAYLKGLTRAIGIKDKGRARSEVQRVVTEFIESDAFDKGENLVYKSFSEAQKANIKPGDYFIVKKADGRYARFRKKEKANAKAAE